MTEIRTPGFCALCKSRCGSVMVTRDGRFVAQEPDPAHPTGRALCVKGKAAPEMIYNGRRLLHPMRRTSPKGSSDPGWQRISWDEALGAAAEGLGRIRDGHGAEAVAFGLTTPSGTAISDNLHWIERFIAAFGSPNVAYGTEICNWHKDFAHSYTFGRGIASPDFANTSCIVLWGHNPSATWLDHATAVSAARARGAALIVVDPRQVGFASRADEWLRVRPGSDGALALGIAREMIRGRLFDEEFVRRWSNGPLLVRSDTMRFVRAGEVAPASAFPPESLLALDAGGNLVAYDPVARRYGGDDGRLDLDGRVELAGIDGGTIPCDSAFRRFHALCEEYTPERVEELCWVPAAQVASVARLLSGSGSVCYYAWSGVGQHTNATQTDRAIACLMALTGSFDAPGGNVDWPKPPARNVSGAELLSAEQRAKCIEFGRSRLGPGANGWVGSDTLYRAILDGEPYRIRGLLDFGRNFLVSNANVRRGAEALAKLDFHVHADVIETPTARFADILLPVNTPWEREALRVGFEGSEEAQSLVQLRAAAIAPLGESRSDAQIVFDLAVRLGFGHHFWNGDIEAGMRHILEPLGVTPDDLRREPQGRRFAGGMRYRAYEAAGFATPTGKVELYCERFRDEGQDPLPRFVEPAMSPNRPASAGFPLVLTSAKVVHFRHSQDRDVPSLRKRSPDPQVSLHPDAAGARGIGNGAWVRLKTPEGGIRMKARLDAGLDPRVVVAQYGWGQSNADLGLAGTDPFGPSNYNDLIPDAEADPISGSISLRSWACEIEALDDAPAQAEAPAS